MRADVDLVVIGGGPAGHAAALRARELEASVAVIEVDQAGGNCVHHACIPTAIMLDTLEGASRARELAFAGVLEVGDELYWNRAVARKQQLVAAMTAGIRLGLRNRDVEFVQGRARLLAPTTVHVALADGGERTLTAGAGVILATGARPRLPQIPGLNPASILWADAALRLPLPPASVALLSGGENDAGIGLGAGAGAGAAFVLEFAHLFAGAGARVTLLAPDDQLLPGYEPQLVDALVQMLRTGGVTVLTGARVEGVHSAEGGQVLSVRAGGELHELLAETVIAPDCRVPHTEGLGLEALGVERRGEAVAVDGRCATSVPGLFAAGDVTGAPMYSHVATHQGQVAAEAALGERTRVDLRALPRVVTTQPELAAVGLTEAQARATGHAVRTGVADLVTNARALVLGQREGIVKLIADSRLGQVLGVHALGPGAAEVAALAATAMRLEATVDDLAAVTHWHPTIAEALALAARRALA